MKALTPFLFILFTFIGINSKAQVLDYKIYPNPFNEKFTVQFYSNNLALKDYEIKVHDVTGSLRSNVIGEAKFGLNLIEVNSSDLDNGVYLISLKMGVDSMTVKGIKSGLVGVDFGTYSSEFIVYPNPCNGKLQFRLPISFHVENVKVVDIKGIEVFQISGEGFVENRIDLTNLNTGLYTVIFENELGEALISQVIKK